MHEMSLEIGFVVKVVYAVVSNANMMVEGKRGSAIRDVLKSTEE